MSVLTGQGKQGYKDKLMWLHREVTLRLIE